MHDVPLPIVYDARGNADRSLDRFSSGNPLEDTVLSLPLLTRFNDSIRESCHHDFLLPSGWIHGIERWSARELERDFIPWNIRRVGKFVASSGIGKI